MTPPTKAPRNNKRTGFTFSNLKPEAADGTVSRGELISQATNESCSSGLDEEDDRGGIGEGIGSPTTPYESYAQQRSISNTKKEPKTGPGVFQYYQDNSKDSLDDPGSMKKASKKQYVDVSDLEDESDQVDEEDKDSLENESKHSQCSSSPETWN